MSEALRCDRCKKYVGATPNSKTTAGWIQLDVCRIGFQKFGSLHLCPDCFDRTTEFIAAGGPND